MGKIGIIDADLLDNGTSHPNLALMKISSYYKKYGKIVELLESYKDLHKYEKVFISKVFNFTNESDLIYKYNNKKNGLKKNIIIGGTGFFEDGGHDLDYEIEHSKPDYELYKKYVKKRIENGEKRSKYIDYLDFSIGFTTRGCFRQCPFCVNKKYNEVFNHSKVSEFLDDTKPKIYLWDDNFLASSNWSKILDDLIETDKPFQFRQGLDIRLMTDKKAEKLSRVKYYGDFIFAFDHIEESQLISEKLKLWRKYSSKSTKLYVLTGYVSQDETDIKNTFARIKILMEHGCLPYIMRYQEYKNSRFRGVYIQIARWCNQPNFFKKMSYREFCELNQEYAKNQDNFCASYRAMIEFEQEFPEIADEYYDIKFSDLNQYEKVK